MREMCTEKFFLIFNNILLIVIVVSNQNNENVAYVFTVVEHFRL